jgi:hypothetical protein
MPYWIEWEGGEEEGPFSRESDARDAAEAAAQQNGYTFKSWRPTLGSGTHGFPADRGDGIRSCTIVKRPD